MRVYYRISRRTGISMGAWPWLLAGLLLWPLVLLGAGLWKVATIESLDPLIRCILVCAILLLIGWIGTLR